MVVRKTNPYANSAVVISYVSIFASVADLALFLTAYDLSLSLYGVALMAITDISGDLLILTQWQGRAEETSFTSSRELRESRSSQKLMEIWASFTVGIFLFICALFVLADSIKSVVVANRQSAGTDQMGLGMAASVLGVMCGSLLAAYKFKIAHELESSTVLANAISSQCSAMTSAAAIFAALLGAYIIYSFDQSAYTPTHLFTHCPVPPLAYPLLHLLTLFKTHHLTHFPIIPLLSLTLEHRCFLDIVRFCSWCHRSRLHLVSRGHYHDECTGGFTGFT